jgi:hypothetical protein
MLKAKQIFEKEKMLEIAKEHRVLKWFENY